MTMTTTTRKTHKDPTGLTAAQAVKEAELQFNKHPTLKSVYANDVLHASYYKCGGQTWYSGAKATRGCGHAHLQPCPGGPMVYRISRMTNNYGLTFNCIEAEGDSWADAIAKIEAQRARERAEFDKYRAERAEREAAELQAKAKKPKRTRKTKADSELAQVLRNPPRCECPVERCQPSGSMCHWCGLQLPEHG